MAQRVVVTLSDDIDGGEAAETITFGLDGKSYEIDLNPANAKKLRKALAPYVEAGRKQANAPARRYHAHRASPPTRRPCAPGPGRNEMEVPARGRIPKKVYEAFTEAER